MKLIFILYFLGSAGLYSDSTSSTSGFTFLKLPFGSSRMQGLGGNGVSLLEGSDAVNINPAGIGFSQMNEFSFSYINWIEDYTGKYVSYIKPYGMFVLGVSGAYFSTEGFEARDENGVTINSDEIKFKNMLASIAVAKSFFMEKFSIGVSLKWLGEDRYFKKENGAVYDVGGVIKLSRWFRIGASKQNISSDNTKIVDAVRYGASIIFSDYLLVTADSVKFTDSKAKTGFGAEMTIPEQVLQYGRFTVRFGYRQSPDYGKNYDDSTLKKLGLDDVSGWSFGIGLYSSQINGKGFGFEYSFTPYGELGKTSQMSFRFQF